MVLFTVLLYGGTTASVASDSARTRLHVLCSTLNTLINVLFSPLNTFALPEHAQGKQSVLPPMGLQEPVEALFTTLCWWASRLSDKRTELLAAAKRTHGTPPTVLRCAVTTVKRESNFGTRAVSMCKSTGGGEGSTRKTITTHRRH